MRYQNRTDAGRRLAARLGQLDLHDPVVLALPRGGVPVGYEVARALGCPLDVLVVRKIGAPGEPEFGVGAVTADGPPSYDPASLATLGLREDDLEPVAEQERQEVDRREARYRGGRTAPEVSGRAVIVVDDGVATGSTARAALRSMGHREPKRLIFAAPICAGDAAKALADEVDDLVCLQAPDDFLAVGQWYEEFAQLSDDDVTELLRQAA
jgi:putative phosphoribosyl transferase